MSTRQFMKSKKYLNKGFTLVELIAVVVVLGLIAVTVSPVINNTLKNNRKKIYEKQINGIVESAKVWGADNIGKLPAEGETAIEVTLGELKINGYADKDLKNPKTDKLFDDINTVVVISNENGILKYNVVIKE